MPRLLVLQLPAALQAAAGAATSTGEIDTAYRPSESTPTRTAAASGRGAAWAVIAVVGGIHTYHFTRGRLPRAVLARARLGSHAGTLRDVRRPHLLPLRCGTRRAARAEHLTVSIAHGSLTHRPFLFVITKTERNTDQYQKTHHTCARSRRAARGGQRAKYNDTEEILRAQALSWTILLLGGLCNETRCLC